MPGPRRVVPLLATVALAVPATAARAQGAGDDQYQDPFANAPSSSPHRSKPAPHREIAQTQKSSQPALSSQPPVSATAPSTSTPAATAPAQTAVPAATALPRTGLDIPGIGLLGIGLLASGVGLRLRTLDASLY